MKTEVSTAKERRHDAIRDILTSYEGSTQESIKEHLQTLGIATSQATLSRDLRELGAVKIPRDDGAVYALADAVAGDDIRSALSLFFRDAEAVGHMVVVHTGPGNAPGLCAVIDRHHWPEIVGTIAGDDTILIITRDQSASRDVAGRLHHMMRKDRE